MKNLLAIGFIVLGTSLFAQKRVKITIEWVFTGIIENYDHNNRMEAYVDGVNAGTSAVTKQSEKNTMVLSVPKGTHTIRVVNFAEYQGSWEEHTRENDYSLDAVYEFTGTVKKKKKINLVFDIDKEIVIVK